MSDTLISILCGEKVWTWDNNNCTISFNENNTGELRCQRELNIWIAAEFDWKLQNVEDFDQSVDLNSIHTPDESSHTISNFTISLTMSKNCIPSLKPWIKPSPHHAINEALLTEPAFLPKTLNLLLEKGNFLTGYDALSPEKEDRFTPHFALRLRFDPSPYPPRNEWKEPKGAPDAVKMWEWKQFCGRKAPPELKREEKDSENRSWWESCVVS